MMTDEARLALALRDTLHLPPRLDLSGLAQTLKLSIAEVESDSFEGALLCSRHRLSGRILVKRGLREEGRKRFTIGHEIGHFILHRQNQISCSSTDIAHWENERDNPERQADRFASELLLPSSEVLRQIGTEWPSFKLIISLAEFFGTTLMATGRKYCEVTPHECAIVWTVDGKITWMYPFARFRHYIGIGRNLSDGTLASQMLAGKTVPEGMQEVPASQWIPSSLLPADTIIWEESRTMPYYRGCLSLLWVKREIRYREPARDELLEELDPQEFTHQRKSWPSKGKRRP
jgi:IrrE N-terminal-like domain